MTEDNFHRRLSRPTEMRAYEQLSAVVAEPETSPGWLQRAIAALHVCAFAIEERLDALGAPEGIVRELERDEPGLTRSFDRLVGQFNALLAEAWEAMKASRGPSEQFHAQLATLADDLRATIGKEFALTEDAMNRMSGAMD